MLNVKLFCCFNFNYIMVIVLMFSFLNHRNQIFTQYVFIVFRIVGHSLKLE